mgnify:CR=1
RDHIIDHPPQLIGRSPHAAMSGTGSRDSRVIDRSAVTNRAALCGNPVRSN